jgi:hypothetical protein
VVVEQDQELHGPHSMFDVVKIKAKVLHLGTCWWMGVASLLHEYDHPKVQPLSALKLWL